MKIEKCRLRTAVAAFGESLWGNLLGKFVEKFQMGCKTLFKLHRNSRARAGRTRNRNFRHRERVAQCIQQKKQLDFPVGSCRGVCLSNSSSERTGEDVLAILGQILRFSENVRDLPELFSANARFLLLWAC